MSDMRSPYKIWTGLKSHALGQAALDLRERYRAAGHSSRLSPLIAMSDPKRTPDIIAWAEDLPEHCAVIYRYEEFDETIAAKLRTLTLARHQQLLIRSEAFLAPCEGLHFRRLTELNAIKALKQSNPVALMTMAAIKTGEYFATLPDLDGLLVSAIFPSQSPSAGAPIGVEGLKTKVLQFDAPIFALGGINLETAAQLKETGIAGIAAIGALTPGLPLEMKEKTPMSKLDLIIEKETTHNTITFKAKLEELDDIAVLNMRKVSDGVYNAYHTGVPRSMGGKGVGTALVKAMSEDAQKEGYKIIPGCPFIAVWFKRKPEWAKMAALNPDEFIS